MSRQGQKLGRTVTRPVSPSPVRGESSVGDDDSSVTNRTSSGVRAERNKQHPVNNQKNVGGQNKPQTVFTQVSCPKITQDSSNNPTRHGNDIIALYIKYIAKIPRKITRVDFFRLLTNNNCIFVDQILSLQWKRHYSLLLSSSLWPAVVSANNLKP